MFKICSTSSFFPADISAVWLSTPLPVMSVLVESLGLSFTLYEIFSLI